MSNVNVKRLVENIRSGTNIYTPLVELVVNAIQAIDAKGIQNGLVEIEVLRNGQADMVDRLEDVDGFRVKDNGIGFTKTNRDAFDTLYTEQKIADGGKGFGRFTCLKYFDRVKVSSTFVEGDAFHDRSFRMGLDKDIIVDEKEGPLRGGRLVLPSRFLVSSRSDFPTRSWKRSVVSWWNGCCPISWTKIAPVRAW
jgi:hypothetical protein